MKNDDKPHVLFHTTDLMTYVSVAPGLSAYTTEISETLVRFKVLIYVNFLIVTPPLWAHGVAQDMRKAGAETLAFRYSRIR